jgi:hypothetical protein
MTRWLRTMTSLGGAAVLATTVGAVCAAQGALAVTRGPAPAAVPHSPDQFVGVWAYNPSDSIDILTGKPEQSPRSAARRPVLGSGRSVPPPTFNGGGRSGLDSQVLGARQAMAREARGVSRDLLEVPESLTIHVSPDAVTFTDDLDRVRTYPVDGSKHHYQLGAARFRASTEWEGPQLRKEVEGDYGFKMTETYLLSPDAQRLFVIVRVGENKKGVRPTGFNRVYDRVSR